MINFIKFNADFNGELSKSYCFQKESNSDPPYLNRAFLRAVIQVILFFIHHIYKKFFRNFIKEYGKRPFWRKSLRSL